jgi:UDP-N-acetylglucosamine 1-carboxyvinyltransferase
VGDSFLVEGGHRLEGMVRVGGAKNSVLPILAATILTEEPCVIQDVPRLVDERIMGSILRHLGGSVNEATDRRTGLRTLRVELPQAATTDIPPQLMQEMRSSIFILGPLLARFKEAVVSQPGGCSLGDRPINWHIDGLTALGARLRSWVVEEPPTIMPDGQRRENRVTYYHAVARELRGATIYLEGPSVGATENLMMAATLAQGDTALVNAAREPEVVDLANFLTAMGAKIRGAGSNRITITGVSRLRGATHQVIPDRIETGTLMVAAAITGGELLLENAVPEHVDALSRLLSGMGVRVWEETTHHGVRLGAAGSGRPRAAGFETGPYPALATDLQPALTALLCLASGRSEVTDAIFRNRFAFAAGLRAFGARAHHVPDACRLIIDGVPSLYGATVEAPDLRGGAALVLAGLAARGSTLIRCAGHVDRGYDALERKLASAGASIIRFKT